MLRFLRILESRLFFRVFKRGETGQVIEFQDLGIHLDSDVLLKMLRPFKEGVQTDHPFEMMLAVSMNVGSGITLSFDRESDRPNLIVELAPLV